MAADPADLAAYVAPCHPVGNTIRIGRYGARPGRGRDRAAATDRGVARRQREAYVAGIVHRWDLQRPWPFQVPAVSGGASWLPQPLQLPSSCPAGVHRCRAACARRVPGRVPRSDPRGLHPGPAPVHRLVPHPVLALATGVPTATLSQARRRPALPGGTSCAQAPRPARARRACYTQHPCAPVPGRSRRWR